MQPIMPDDRRSLTLRLSVLQYALALLFAGLAVAFWTFQIANHERFREMADNNYMQRLPLPAPRGVLFDRNGRVLVNNQSTTNIVLVREQTKNVEGTLQIVARAAGVDEAQLNDEVRLRRREPSYRPIVLIENATHAQVAAVAARKLELPGILRQDVPSREYTATDMAAHLFGYVGEVRETQLQRPEYAGVEAGAIVGQSGVEQAYNKVLMGAEGNKSVIVNVRGQEIQTIGERPPVVGSPLQLTIDADLQKAAEDGFRHFGVVNSGKPYNGAAIVLDPRNGEVLSLVSLPTFDPNKFAGGIDRATWTSLMTDKDRPLQNRALQGTYSPGSTFKIVVATAALEEGLVTPDFRVHCGGGASFYGRFFQCHLKRGHGSVDMRHAIEQSCNVYFYTLGQMLGVDRIHKWASALGLGEINGIDLPNEVSGLVPSEEWKQRVRKERWYPGETISVAIGQGQVNVTPLSLAVMMMTVANGGTRYTPHVLKGIDRGKGWEPFTPPPPRSDVRMKNSTVRALRDGLWLAVNGAGTAGRARIAGRDVAGKTGTAQVISLTGAQRMRGKQEVRDHGWFVFLAPKENPELAGVIFAEHAEHGYYGASIAKHIIETYYAKKEGQPLPVLTAPPPKNAVVATADAAPAARVPAFRAGGGQ
ncbi:MAG: penicillin-binding protein 2 [Vicinamibacterales bacterium]